MVFIWVLGYIVGFCIFLGGSMGISALAGALAARISRALLVWVPLTLALSVVFQFVYGSAGVLARWLWFVNERHSPFWDRYWSVLSSNWPFVLTWGLLFGIGGWLWCLKRSGQFLRKPSIGAADHLSVDANRALRKATLAVIAKKAEEQNRDNQGSRESN